MYERFGLVLTITSACNLRCRYCYAGTKTPCAMTANGPYDRCAMTARVAHAAIDRAVQSVALGGTLELGFFGGEPLLEAERVAEYIHYAQGRCAASGLSLQLSMTTNGTVTTDAAWRVMTHPEMQLSVSHDGQTLLHDRHRRTAAGHPTSARVLETIGRLLDEGVDPHVVMVVRPDTAASLADRVLFLREHGVRHIDPTLDLWTKWNRDDAARLHAALVRCADVWADGLPEHSISWFDEKAARLLSVASTTTARCGFGDGEVAVAVSGNLYPCERLIGDDAADNPMRLDGHATEGDDFLFAANRAPGRQSEGCAACAISEGCATTCRCSNYIRTGDVRRPDGLLCMLDQTCTREVARVLRRLPVVCETSVNDHSLSTTYPTHEPNRSGGT